jgi:hypothetical protein
MTMDFDPMDGSANHSVLQEPMFTASPIDQSYPMAYQAASHDPAPGGSMSPQVHNRMASMPQGMSSMSDPYPHHSQQLRRPTPISTSMSTAGAASSTMASPAHIQRTPHRRLSADVQTSYSSNGSRSS